MFTALHMLHVHLLPPSDQDTDGLIYPPQPRHLRQRIIIIMIIIIIVSGRVCVRERKRER